MEDIVWFLIVSILALIALAILLSSIRRRPQSLHQNAGRCPECETPMSLRRVSPLKSHALLGEWECPHCGARITKKGRTEGVAT
jgi:hypothetical protein